MAALPHRRFHPPLPEAPFADAHGERSGSDHARTAEHAVLLPLVRALARQAAAEAWGRADHTPSSEPQA